MSNSRSHDVAPTGRPRVIFFGMQGAFSLPVFSALLASGYEICAVVLPSVPVPGQLSPPIRLREPPASTRSARFVLPMAGRSTPHALLQLAWERHIPVWEVSRLAHAETLTMLRSLQPDVICVACFPLRIPPAVLHLPRFGCLNVHPSLLPANRGPEPLFWTFRHGVLMTGVTIHVMNEGMDSGDILAQEQIAVPDGISYAELEMHCAQLGGQLLTRAISDLVAGRAHRQPQDESLSSYYPFPLHEDFVVQLALWSARHVYNFIRGVGHWDEPIVLDMGEQQLIIRDVISYSRETMSKTSMPPHLLMEQVEGHMRVYCSDGWVEVYKG